MAGSVDDYLDDDLEDSLQSLGRRKPIYLEDEEEEVD